MNASFEEKSVWVQLICLFTILGAYFVLASRMLAAGITELIAYLPLFIGTIVVLVVLLVAGHVAVAVASRPDGRDERDRLIQWRAESNSSWLLAAGVIVAITGLTFGIGTVWIAHLLLLSLFLSEVLRLMMQLVYYRRGL